MNVQDYISNKKLLQEEILNLLSGEQNLGSIDLKQVTSLINDQKIREDANEFRSFLYLIVNIANNHHRSPDFFVILNKILILFKEEFPKYLTENEILNIFYENYQIILFLIENKLLKINKYFADFMDDISKCTNYYIKEIKPFLSQEKVKQIERKNEKISDDPELFEKFRQIGENEQKVCQYIRNDDVDNFIIYITQTNTSLNGVVGQSIFETNKYFYHYKPTIIEYAVFYGSIQIFNYLRMNGVKLTSSLWLCAVHGGNAEIIHLLEENKVILPKNSYESIFIEAVKCHHNDIAHYFDINFLNNERNEQIYFQIINSYNYEFYPEDFNSQICFLSSCNSGQYFFVDRILQENKNFNTNFLKHFGFDFDECISNPFYVAIQNDHISIAELLFQRPETDVNCFITVFGLNLFEQSVNPLMYAIWMNSIKMVKLLLSHKYIDVNLLSINKEKSSKDFTFIKQYNPLIQAVSYENVEIVEALLLHEKINPNSYEIFSDTSTNKNLIKKFTALHVAIRIQNIDIINLLLNHPKIDPNTKTIWKTKENKNKEEEEEEYVIKYDKEYNETPLCFAIRNETPKRQKIVELLLKNSKININKKSSSYSQTKIKERTALHIAIKKKDHKIVKLLMERPEIDANNRFIFSTSSGRNNELTPLQTAIFYDDKDMVSLLISYNNIDINQVGIFYKDNVKYKLSALNLAILLDKKEIVRILLMHPNIEVNNTSISYKKNRDNPTFSLTNILDLTKHKLTPLQNAVLNADDEMLSILLSCKNIDINHLGFFINHLNTLEFTALHFAIFENKTSKFEIISSHENVDINSTIKSEETTSFSIIIPTLGLAILLDNIEIVQSLVSHPKIDINGKIYHKFKNYNESDFTTILHFAFQSKNDKIIQILLSNSKIDVNLTSYIKRSDLFQYQEIINTTLQLAINYGNIDVIKFLLNKPETDLNQKSKIITFLDENVLEKEDTPINIAINTKNYEIIQIICEFYIQNNKISSDCLQKLINEIDDEKIKSIINKLTQSKL